MSTIRWFFAPVGAAVYTAPNIFFPLSQTLQYKPDAGVGELGVSHFTWRRGVAPSSVDGVAVHGTAENFLGRTEYTGPVPWEDVPECRVPNLLRLGGFSTMPRSSDCVIRFTANRSLSRFATTRLGGYSTFTRYRELALALGGLRGASPRPIAIALGGSSTVSYPPEDTPSEVIVSLDCRRAPMFRDPIAIGLFGNTLGGPEVGHALSVDVALGGGSSLHIHQEGGVALAATAHVETNYHLAGGIALGGVSNLIEIAPSSGGVAIAGGTTVFDPHCFLCDTDDLSETITCLLSCPEIPLIDGYSFTMNLVRAGGGVCRYEGVAFPDGTHTVDFVVGLWVGHEPLIAASGNLTEIDGPLYHFDGVPGDDYACDPFEWACENTVYLDSVLQAFTMTSSFTTP